MRHTKPKNQRVKSISVEIDETENKHLDATGFDMDMKNRDCVLPSQTRKIGPTRRSLSGVYAFRGETAVPFESALERDFLIGREFSLNVLDVIPQPVQIPFVAPNGRTYTYTPDFLVYYRLGNKSFSDYPRPLLVEIKPRDELRQHWRDWKSKFRAAFRHANEHGWAFAIYDETRIRGQSLENIRFLERYKRMQCPVEESRCVIESVQQMGSAPFHYLLARHFMGIYKAEGVSHIWHLLSTRQLDCDITRPLSDSTELWLPSV
jgi:hypothetical protein